MSSESEKGVQKSEALMRNSTRLIRESVKRGSSALYVIILPDCEENSTSERESATKRETGSTGFLPGRKKRLNAELLPVKNAAMRYHQRPSGNSL